MYLSPVSGTETEATEEWYLLAGLSGLFILFSYVVQSHPTGMMPSTVSWDLPYWLLFKTIPYRCAHTKSDGGNSSTEVFFFPGESGCIKSTVKINQYKLYLWFI